MAKYQEWVQPDKLILLQGWARDGLTDEQIASNVGIATSTLYEWKKKYKDISEALKKGKEVVDIEVENALLKRALGYEYEETTTEIVWNPQTECYEEKVHKTVKKQMAADTTAAIFWLKNRKPEVWRDKREVTTDGKVSLQVSDVDDL